MRAPHSLPPSHLQGYAWARWLLHRLGWRVCFHGFPTPQGVIVGYPHTSNWDFVLMVLVKWATGLQVQFLAKHSLFAIPVFSRWLRALGGLPVDRSAARGVVSGLVAHIEHQRAQGLGCWIGISPEGTRRLTAGWKSGFYQLARQAGLPVGVLRIDYGRREVALDTFIELSGDWRDDYARLAQAYDGVQGFHPEQASPIRPLPSSSDIPNNPAP